MFHATQSNQWAIGVGLRRSTIYDSNRWLLWVSTGFTSYCLAWSKNPKAPKGV